MAQSHGRGGAGNINAAPSPSLQPTDLQTPTLKSALYTTGRGGSGNMAINDPLNPAEARAAQDVEAPAHHSKEMQGTYHWGRGGEGNMTTVGKSERQQSKERKSSKERTPQQEPTTTTTTTQQIRGKVERRSSFQQVVNKGKEMLGLKATSDNTPKEGSAIKNESAIDE